MQQRLPGQHATQHHLRLQRHLAHKQPLASLALSIQSATGQHQSIHAHQLLRLELEANVGVERRRHGQAGRDRAQTARQQHIHPNQRHYHHGHEHARQTLLQPDHGKLMQQQRVLRGWQQRGFLGRRSADGHQSIDERRRARLKFKQPKAGRGQRQRLALDGQLTAQK